MAVTINPAGVVIVGLGVAKISYVNGAAVTQTAVTGTAAIVTAADISPFADQSPVTANGDIITYMAKNHGMRFSYKCYLIGGATAIVSNPPVINTRIDFDFHVSGTYGAAFAFTPGSGDISGIVKSSKVSITDDVAVLDVEMDIVAGMTFVAGP